MAKYSTNGVVPCRIEFWKHQLQNAKSQGLFVTELLEVDPIDSSISKRLLLDVKLTNNHKILITVDNSLLGHIWNVLLDKAR